MFVPNFKIVGEIVAETSVMKHGQIKGMISMRMLNFSYTIQCLYKNSKS